jgi:hypothetical protein
MRYHIHYTERGDGDITITRNGQPYNGKRHIYINAKDEATALRKLKEMYVKDGIKEIREVVVA